MICEGAFSWLGNFCAADILKKDGNCYSLYEVKNSTALKKEFLLDLAFQRMIIQKCDIPVGDCFLILNGNKIDEENAKGAGQVSVERVNRIEKDGFCFDIFCVTKQVCLLQKQAEKKLFPLGKIKRKDAPMPTISMGEQCQSPYPCWYVDFCKNCENAKNN